MNSIETLFISLSLLVVLGVVLAEVVLLREPPVLVPILVFGAFGMIIVGATIAVVAPSTPFLPWFAPMGVLLASYVIHRLYEGWGM